MSNKNIVVPKYKWEADGQVKPVLSPVAFKD